jgi:hypothetical protein
MEKIIGREEELSILESAFKSTKPEFIALFGRRRVGKTFLVRNLFSKRKNTIFFSVTGMKDGKTSQQIKNFVNQIGESFYGFELRPETPKNWFDTFELLTSVIKTVKNKNIVLFFDEFPWMVTQKSELLTAFAYFWNHYGSSNPRIKLIICGSSAGWILKKIVNDRDALYNRVTRRIHLEPFSLYETKKYLIHRNIRLDNRQITHLYMVLGGIPFYLDQVKPGLSAIQVVAHLAFKKHSFLLDEFENLYATLFDGGEGHIELARIIASHQYGIGQEELTKLASHISSGGTLVSRLKDLEKAGFVQRFKPFGVSKKGIFYKMIDEYSLFYFRWIEPIKDTLLESGMSKGYWERLQYSQAWNSWAGYAFESLCHKHIFQIMQALEISPMAIPYTWRYVPPKGSQEHGAQIDLLFDREDGIISVCEIKYMREAFVIDKTYAAKLALKLELFEKQTKTKKQFLLSIISASGLKENMYSEELVSGACLLDDLFKKVSNRVIR